MTRLLLLLGDPVSHSLSPSLHNAAIAHHRLPYFYAACRVRPDDLEAAVDGIRAMGVAGANVTVPHKERIIPFLDDLTESARAIGAVNTLFWDGDRLVGDNTDVVGFLNPLEQFSLPIDHVLLLGAGGAARAVAYGLRGAKHMTIAARRLEQAEALISDLGLVAVAISLEEAADHLHNARLVVNTTPVGGPGMEGKTPVSWPHTVTDTIAYDLLYHPLPTRFLTEATRVGADAIDGRAMLTAQASAAFEKWTGTGFPGHLDLQSIET